MLIWKQRGKNFKNMKYFAYGSNMSADRMTKRGVNFSSRKFAKLNGYKLVFNKKSKTKNEAYANIIESDNDVVEGVLYEFPNEKISILDKYEDYPNGYCRKELVVIDENSNSITATVYIAQNDKIVEGMYPTQSYLGYLLEGKDLLSEEYFECLEQTKTCD